MICMLFGYLSLQLSICF